uniref:Uncharacterized protein n=1 Tax=Arion vulgaris TaxID=1028688 RepID=A0A0B7AXF4_9EUPU
MKKFRYVDPSTLNIFQRARPFILAFVGWNVFAICVWKYMDNRSAERDPAWDTRSDAEKIAIIQGANPKNFSKYKFTLFGPSKKQDNTAETANSNLETQDDSHTS